MLTNSAGEWSFQASTLTHRSQFKPLPSSQSSKLCKLRFPVSVSFVVAISMSSTNDQQQPQHRKKRPFCLKCSKPASVCLCSRFATPPIENEIGITILQHVAEKNHPLNSVRVASLGLKNLDVVTVSDVFHHAEFDVRPLKMSSGGGLAEKNCGLIDCNRNGGIGGEIGRHGRDHQMDTDKARSFTFTDGVTVNGTSEKVDSFASDDVSCLEKFGKCLYDVTDVKSRDISDFVQQNRTNQMLQLENLGDDHVKEEISAKEAVVSNSTDRKCQVTYCYDRLLISMDIAAKPDIGRALNSPIGREIASNGFVVKKIKRKQISKVPEFEDIQEFDIVIPPGSSLLFPSKKSICLESLDKAQFDVKHLIVLDGTWPKARRMYYENPWLQFLPHLRLDSVKASLYSDVRHQPKAGCLSTVESIVCALKGLGCDSDGLQNLLNVFESMVEDQRRCKRENLSKIDQSGTV